VQLQIGRTVADVRTRAAAAHAPGLGAHARRAQRDQDESARGTRHRNTCTPDTWICSDESMITIRSINPPASTSTAGSTTL
jgi:hypothetical protein